MRFGILRDDTIIRNFLDSQLNNRGFLEIGLNICGFLEIGLSLVGAVEEFSIFKNSLNDASAKLFIRQHKVRFRLFSARNFPQAASRESSSAPTSKAFPLPKRLLKTPITRWSHFKIVWCSAFSFPFMWTCLCAVSPYTATSAQSSIVYGT